ncbi:MAG: shikimate dehydrogenase [Acidobacteriaceae bacterium]|nr:shikimate dehydrogenase [Bryobacterales bacterium]MBV9500490.1 shikimate dehydrogenase [Acidobacteriaceae bacterium]
MPVFPRNLPRICVALGFPTVSQLSRAAEQEYKDGNALLEFRLDYLPDPAGGTELIRRFKKKFVDACVLATCRHKEAHGYFPGPVERQLAVLENAAGAGAALVDLEIESAERLGGAAQTLREHAALIISAHNFEKTPALEPLLRRLQRVPANAYKIAITARKPSDNLRLLHCACDHAETPLILLAMAEAGIPSRILSPSRGSLYTYAASREGPGTAPGQIPAHTMKSLYRPGKLTRQTRIFGLVANPVAHSKSPAIHNRGFQARRVDAVYLPFLVTAAQLKDWMQAATELPVAGFSVTIPHKQRIMRYLDVIEPLAKRIGAVNTVWRKGGKWRGTNTDVDGVLKPLRRRMTLAGSSVLIAGYGGGARAAAAALADARANVYVTGRNMKSAQALARAVKGEAIALADAQEHTYNALIHATPVGMAPDGEGCLFESIPAEIVFDMVYNPRQTVLLKRAKAAGCTVISGSEMLLEQALSQFEIFTGQSAPRAIMEAALERAL